ncbi:MAG: putative DNA-binding domain-containing protein [Betaproteobacteria bacterium]|nr:putative DNA-binding domain-containing protein [Betaproteobacteria bacterium]
MLRDVQRAMAELLMAGGTPDEKKAGDLIRGGKLSAARRMEVYRHNVLSNLRGALKDIFPVVNRIVGDAFFLHAADQFIRVTPSHSGDLNQFGREWPSFLANYPHATELPYLADVAKLEWAWHECFHAADAAPMDLGRLASVAPDAHGLLVFHLHPAVRLLVSAYPVLRIWQVNQPDFAGDMQIDWAQGGDALMVRRDSGVGGGLEVVIQSLAAGEYRFMCELHARRTLERAAAAALETDSEFDLQAFLLECAQRGVIVDFSRDAT